MNTSDRELVKSELVKLKKMYSPFTIKSETGKFPLVFTLTFQPSRFMNVDFEGVVIPFAINEKYPEEIPQVGNVQALSTQPLPKGLLKKFTNALRNQCEVIFNKHTKDRGPILLELLDWFDRNCATLAIDPDYVESYMAEGMDGSSMRRYAFKVALIKEEDDEKSDSDVSDGSISEEEEESDEADGGIDNANVMESLLHPPPQITLGTVGEHDLTLNFEQIDMKGISVLECSELNIMVACERCQKQIEAKNLTHSNTFSCECEACKKEIEVRFYAVPITAVQPASSIQQQQTNEDDIDNVHTKRRWAQIELSGCTFFDTLPTCQFRVLCFDCSTTNDMGRLKLRSNNSIICRKCHKELSVIVSNLSRELLVDIAKSQPAISSSKPSPKSISKAGEKRKKMVKLQGITEGTQLPNKGTCKHYKHSKRWLRFPCCGRAFPCDVCHEEQTGDPSTFATRMICGYCSHEQGCADTCKYCQKKLTKKIIDSSAKKKSTKIQKATSKEKKKKK
jgi:hypothetical protein